jgi:hypothetical protein
MKLEPPPKQRFLSEPIDCFESNIREWELLTKEEQIWVKHTLPDKLTPSLEKELINVQLRRRGQFINNPNQERILQSDLTVTGHKSHIKVKLTAEIHPNKAKEILQEAKRVEQDLNEYDYKLEASRIYNRYGWPDSITDKTWIPKRFNPTQPTNLTREHGPRKPKHNRTPEKRRRLYRALHPRKIPKSNKERSRQWRERHAAEYQYTRIANRIYKKDGLPPCLITQIAPQNLAEEH